MMQVRAYVTEVLDLVDLTPLAHSLVGEPAVGAGGGAGLSSEARKRLTIAVELVANPSVVFMDEPTSGECETTAVVRAVACNLAAGRSRSLEEAACSGCSLLSACARTHTQILTRAHTGLDARSASIVMRSVRNIACSGRTIIGERPAGSPAHAARLQPPVLAGSCASALLLTRQHMHAASGRAAANLRLRPLSPLPPALGYPLENIYQYGTRHTSCSDNSSTVD